MPIITRKFDFDYGHRVLGHEGKCANLHGHRGVAEVTVEAAELDNLGRVVDFSVLKTLIGGWIDERWDHNMLLHKDDPLLDDLGHEIENIEHSRRRIFGPKSPYILPVNPTAENLAQDLLVNAQKVLDRAGSSHIRVRHVRLYETPNCYADAFVDG